MKEICSTASVKIVTPSLTISLSLLLTANHAVPANHLAGRVGDLALRADPTPHRQEGYREHRRGDPRR